MADLPDSSESGFLHVAFGGWREVWEDVWTMGRQIAAICKRDSKRGHEFEKGRLKVGESVAALLMPTVW